MKTLRILSSAGFVGVMKVEQGMSIFAWRILLITSGLKKNTLFTPVGGRINGGFRYSIHRRKATGVGLNRAHWVMCY